MLLLFQIFFLVVVFALYNGLVLLPVLLAWLGPEGQASTFEAVDSLDHVKREDGEVQMEERTPLEGGGNHKEGEQDTMEEDVS